VGARSAYGVELVEGAVGLHEVGLQEDLQLVDLGREPGGCGGGGPVVAVAAALGSSCLFLDFSVPAFGTFMLRLHCLTLRGIILAWNLSISFRYLSWVNSFGSLSAAANVDDWLLAAW
jgi:hypothetical protein